MIIWNLVWMNTEYYNEYRQCLSPKGQLYLKADNEGKPDLTFNHHFRRSLVSSCHMYHTLTYTNTYTESHIFTYRTTHYATILTRSVCPSHITVLLEAATACLLAYSRSDFDHESETSIWERSEKLSPCHHVFYRTLTRYEFEIKEKSSDQRICYIWKNMIIPYSFTIVRCDFRCK